MPSGYSYAGSQDGVNMFTQERSSSRMEEEKAGSNEVRRSYENVGALVP